MFVVEVHSGPTPDSQMAFCSRHVVGPIEHVVEAIRVKCGQAIATRGRVVWADFFEDGAKVYSRAFCEDCASA